MPRHARTREGATHPGKLRSRKHSVEPVLQIICLASGGGPAEDNVTGFLVRSLSTKWNKNSVLAVDAGSHLASITRILESDFPRFSEQTNPNPGGKITTPRKANGAGGPPSTPSKAASEAGYESSDSSSTLSVEPTTRILEEGPFANLPFPFESARANALHVVRECVSTYLITHPHLDHLSAFAMNTAAFHNTSRPKRLAAMPSTVHAIKTHIFNNVIWPNLTDEDGGVGFVSFQRLAEGGNVAVGDGRRAGYIEVCDGLCVKGLKISHGQCVCSPSTHSAHGGSDVGLSHAKVSASGLLSIDSVATSPTKIKRPSFSLPSSNLPGSTAATGSAGAEPPTRPATSAGAVVVDSTAYFIQDDHSGREVLVFGDVEPDDISLSPRTVAVWTEAAPKIASGHLKAVVIECSYDDSQGDGVLFGHLAPRWLIRELNALAEMVRLSKSDRRASRKRKRSHRSSDGTNISVEEAAAANMMGPPATGADGEVPVCRFHDVPTKKGRKGSVADGPAEPARDHAMSPRSGAQDEPAGASHRNSGDGDASAGAPADPEPPLAGVSVLIMHVKDTFKDGPPVSETILKQLREHEARLKEQDGVGLGCDFVLCQAGGSYYF